MAGGGAMGAVLLDLLVVLAAARLLGVVAEKIGQPAVVGELLAGVALGPSLLGWIAPPDLGSALASGDGGLILSSQALLLVAELGVILLLFEVGLTSDLREMTRVGRSAVFVAILGVVVSFAAGVGASVLLARLGVWPDAAIFHVFIGATFTATSVGITARVLADLGRLSTPDARVILGAAVLDDVVGLIILAVVSALAAGALSPEGLALKIGLAVGFLVLLVGAGLALAPRIVGWAQRHGAAGSALAAGFAVAIGYAFLAVETGLAAVVGAFAAGLVLAGSTPIRELREGVRPLATIFTPFFFAVMGLHVDLGALAAGGPLMIAVGLFLSVIAILGKLAAGLGVVEKGVSKLVVAVGMVPRGEVGLIFAGLGLTALGIGAAEYSAIILVVIVTTFVTPPALKVALARRGSTLRLDRDQDLEVEKVGDEARPLDRVP
ncbi:MAG TPA: cation:proton antiporter [Candidatus Thermoplasmatota archaeon]|nr:cation:proton antiporter [Candidatus Thermoplasmatota archaeon]